MSRLMSMWFIIGLVKKRPRVFFFFSPRNFFSFSHFSLFVRSSLRLLCRVGSVQKTSSSKLQRVSLSHFGFFLEKKALFPLSQRSEKVVYLRIGRSLVRCVCCRLLLLRHRRRRRCCWLLRRSSSFPAASPAASFFFFFFSTALVYISSKSKQDEAAAVVVVMEGREEEENISKFSAQKTTEGEGTKEAFAVYEGKRRRHARFFSVSSSSTTTRSRLRLFVSPGRKAKKQRIIRFLLLHKPLLSKQLICISRPFLQSSKADQDINIIIIY